MVITIMIIMFLLIDTSYVLSETYYMCGTGATCGTGWSSGNDSANGTAKSTPWLTLDHSYATMSAGDTLIIGDGTYTGVANCTNVYINRVPPRSPTLWTTIKAENNGERGLSISF